MRRREVLASAAALLATPLAGCGHPPVVLDLNEATAEDIADEVSMLAEPGSEEYRLVQTALENGSATRRGRYELFDDAAAVRVDDAFYEVSETRLGSSEVTVYEVLVDLDPTEATPARGEIAFEELPEADRRRLEPLLDEEPPDRDGYDAGVGYGTLEEVGNESVFVPEREYDIVVHEEDRYRVGVDSRAATEVEYRYEATELAPDVVAYADQIRAMYLFELGAFGGRTRGRRGGDRRGVLRGRRSLPVGRRAHPGPRRHQRSGLLRDVAPRVRGHRVHHLRGVVGSRGPSIAHSRRGTH